MLTGSQTGWLKAGAASLIAFGLLAVAGTAPALSAPIAFMIDLAFWPLDGAQSVAEPETRLLLAVGGGLLAGWGATLWVLVDRLGARDGDLIRAVVGPAILTWFALDSGGSIASGAWMNAILNLGFLALFLLPLRRSALSRA